ncbi:MAG: NUDIX hydrolase [Clostridia bacterium]|nr:NUDIX hydrolase [Clostridia bacterium]
MELTEKKISRKVIYEGKIINVYNDTVLLPNGKETHRELVEHHGGVCVAALTDEGNLLFVRQFRYPYGRVLLELPAGKLEKGEDPLSAGMRELEEECGVVAEKVIPMGTVYPTVAYCTEIIHLFLVRELSKTRQHLDDGEFLSVEEIPLKEAVKLVMNGEISDSKTVALILKTEKLLAEGKI